MPDKASIKKSRARREGNRTERDEISSPYLSYKSAATSCRNPGMASALFEGDLAPIKEFEVCSNSGSPMQVIRPFVPTDASRRSGAVMVTSALEVELTRTDITSTAAASTWAVETFRSQ